jgi:hypothetical protein
LHFELCGPPVFGRRSGAAAKEGSANNVARMLNTIPKPRNTAKALCFSLAAIPSVLYNPSVAAPRHLPSSGRHFIMGIDPNALLQSPEA